MAHLAGEEFVAFLGLLAAGDIEEDAEHRAVQHAFVFALPPGRDPADFLTDHDAEIDLVLSHDRAGGGEGGAHAVAVCRVDMGGEILERDFGGVRHAPEIIGALVEPQLVGIDVPGPERDAGAFDGHPEVAFMPDRQIRPGRRHRTVSIGHIICRGCCE